MTGPQVRACPNPSFDTNPLPRSTTCFCALSITRSHFSTNSPVVDDNLSLTLHVQWYLLYSIIMDVPRLVLHFPPLVLSLRPITRASLFTLLDPCLHASIPSNYATRKLTVLIIKEPRLPLLHHVPNLFTNTIEHFSLLRQSSQDPHHLIHPRRLSKSSVAILETCPVVGMTRL